MHLGSAKAWRMNTNMNYENIPEPWPVRLGVLPVHQRVARVGGNWSTDVFLSFSFPLSEKWYKNILENKRFSSHQTRELQQQNGEREQDLEELKVNC